MSGIGVKINVNYDAVKAAGAEAKKLKGELSDLGSMNVPIHTQLNQAGSAAQIFQQNQAIQRSIERILKPGTGGSFSTGPDGGRFYMSPGGTRYAFTPPQRFLPPSQDDGSGALGDTFNLRFTGLRKIAAAAIGGVSLYNWWENSKESASRFEVANSMLRRRGGAIEDSILEERAKHGSGPLDQADIYDLLNGKTGLTGKSLDSIAGSATIQGFLTGAGGRTLASYYAGIFPSIKEKDPEKLSVALTSAAENLRKTATAFGAGARYSEVLSLNQRLLADFTSSRGGEGFTESQSKAIAAMQMALWGTGKTGQAESGVNILARLNRGVQEGGVDPGSRILFAKALGIDKVHSLSDLWRFNERQAEGATPENLQAVFSEVRKVAGARGLRNADAEAMKKLMVRELFHLTPAQVNVVSNPQFRRILPMLASHDNRSAMTSILQAARRQNPGAFQGMSDEDILKTLGADVMRADAENQVADLTTIGRPALRTSIASKILKAAAKKTGADIIDRSKGIFSPGGPPPIQDPKNPTMQELYNWRGYYQATGGYPERLHEIEETITQREGANFLRGLPKEAIPSAPSRGLSNQEVTLGSSGGVSEITQRLDKLLDALTNRDGQPHAPTIDLRRWK